MEEGHMDQVIKHGICQRFHPRSTQEVIMEKL